MNLVREIFIRILSLVNALVGDKKLAGICSEHLLLVGHIIT